MTLDFVTSDDEIARLLSRGSGPFTITGRTSNRQEAAFFDCYVQKHQGTEDGRLAKFIVNRGFFGHSSARALDANIIHATATMTALDEWAISGASALEVTAFDDSEARSFTVHADSALRDRTVMARDAKITLKFFVARHFDRLSARFELQPYFEVLPLAECNFDVLISRLVRPLENFISLGTGRINFARTLILKLDKGRSQVFALFPTLQAKAATPRWLTWPRGLFSLLDIDDTLAERIVAWLDIYDRYRTVCDQLFYTLYNPQYVEAYFLSLIQIFEGYHRLRQDMTQTRMSADAYSELVAQSTKTLSSKQRRKLSAAFKHGNQVSLEQRLHEATKRFGRIIPGVLRDQDRLVFGQDCAHMRNAMAHHLPGQQEIDKAQLHTYANFILRLLIVGLMQETGFPDAAIRHSLQNGASIIPEQRLGA
jgi:hypothetical protein